MGKQIVCHKCGRDWEYKGQARFFATCPSCHTNVKIGEVENKYV